MPRRVQDIVPGDRRSIRNIPLERPSVSDVSEDQDLKPKRRESRSSASREGASAREIPIRRVPITPPPAPPARRPRKPRRNGSWILILIGIIVVVAAAGYIASTYFSRATFTIVPKSIPVHVNSTYVAQSDATATQLPYELVTVHGAASTTVAATDGQKVSTKAQGKVTIYNAYSTQSQTLVAGTRLADASGHIYRTASSVVVPGYKKSTGGAIIPGSLNVTVTADQPGESYNISRTGSAGDLKIVAYKGTPRYEGFYARPATDISGGFVGTKKIVSSATLASTSAALQAQLTATLLAQVHNSIPDGYILFDALHVDSFSEPSIGGTDPSSAIITREGSVTGVLLKKDRLIARLAGDEAVESFGRFSYNPVGLENLEVSIANPDDFSPTKKSPLILRIKGDMQLVGAIPVDEMRQILAGVSLSETQNLLKPYNQIIETGSGELIPPWSHVPSDPKRISIVVESPKQ